MSHNRRNLASRIPNAMPTDTKTCIAADDYEAAYRYHWDPESEEWKRSEKMRLRLAEKPFEKGGARVCYKAMEVAPGGIERVLVAKLFMRHPKDKLLYFNETMTQMLANEYAEEFNARVIGSKIRFNTIHVCLLAEREGQLATLEPFLDGKYEKHNDNDGHVCSNDATAQAFSHFSWEASNHQLLVCDIQGVGTTYTDPQIHSVSGEGFGVGNMGPEGVFKFFKTHRCNEVCRALNLPAPNREPKEIPKTSQELENKMSREATREVEKGKRESKRSSLGQSLLGMFKALRTSSDESPAPSPIAAARPRLADPGLLVRSADERDATTKRADVEAPAVRSSSGFRGGGVLRGHRCELTAPYCRPSPTLAVPYRKRQAAAPRASSEEPRRRDSEEPRREKREERGRRDSEELRREKREPRREKREEPRRRDSEEPRRRGSEEPRRRDSEEPRRRDSEEPRRRDSEELRRRGSEESCRRDSGRRARGEASFSGVDSPVAPSPRTSEGAAPKGRAEATSTASGRRGTMRRSWSDGGDGESAVQGRGMVTRSLSSEALPARAY